MLGDAEAAPGATNMARPYNDDTTNTESPVEPASPVASHTMAPAVEPPASASGRPWPERTRGPPAFYAPDADALCKAAGPTSTAAQEVDDASEDGGSDADSEDTDAGTSEARLLPSSLLAAWWNWLGAQH